VRILVHDFSGHPFQAELARSLATRGHDVLHVECGAYTSGKGSFDSGLPNAEFVSLSVGGGAFERYKIGKRAIQELRYGVAFVREVRRFRPDLVVSCNDPLLSKAVWTLWAVITRLRWIYWLQDLYSVAIMREAARRGPVDRTLASLLRWLEQRMLRSSDAIVSITADFDATLESWGVRLDARTVIENWAPLDELLPQPRDNSWRRDQGLDDAFVYLYAGTLGLKHDPDLLYDLAADEPDSVVVVVSEGLGADRLHSRQAEQNLPNLRILPFQPWSRLPEVLGAADVLVVLLEAEAGAFSVPSKVLTCLCAGRPILASIPEANLAARTIRGAGAGLVVAPGDRAAILEAARTLRDDRSTREQMGSQARAYAVEAFDIHHIPDRFEAVIDRAAGAARKAPGE
jgi:glycosyltransferase involved in cell wall biosynthesis